MPARWTFAFASGRSTGSGPVSCRPCWCMRTCWRSATRVAWRSPPFCAVTSSIDSSSVAELQPLAALLAAWRDSVGDQPVLLVGAAARDLLLVHVHRVAVFRATED